MTLLTANQIRNGRAMLGWRPRKLAVQSGVSLAQVQGFENGTLDVDHESSEMIRLTLSSRGLEFIPEIGSGAGVRLMKGA